MSMHRLTLLLALLGLTAAPLAAPTSASAQEEGGEDEDEDDEFDLPEAGDQGGGEDDFDDWSYEGEEEKPVEEKKEEKKQVELPPEPKRYGVSGNWYEVPAECVDCKTLLGQKFGIEEPLVMRQFFDYMEIESKRTGGLFVFPSISQSQEIGVKDAKGRVIVWRYVMDTGTRLTDTYATVWDLKLMADEGLLYGRKYEVQAWTDEAYKKTDGGYASDKSYIGPDKVLKYVDLPPVQELSPEKKRFQVGESARINFVGYAAFVRSDVSRDAIAAEQKRLTEAAEAEKKRLADQKEYFKKGEQFMDDKAWEEAAAAFEKARELGLESLDLNYNLGFSFYKLDRYDAAKKEYQSLLDVDPRDTDVRYNLARIFEKEKDFDAAIKEYQAILKFNPDDGAARKRLDIVKAARDMLN